MSTFSFNENERSRDDTTGRFTEHLGGKPTGTLAPVFSEVEFDPMPGGWGDWTPEDAAQYFDELDEKARRGGATT